MQDTKKVVFAAMTSLLGVALAFKMYKRYYSKTKDAAVTEGQIIEELEDYIEQEIDLLCEIELNKDLQLEKEDFY